MNVVINDVVEMILVLVIVVVIGIFVVIAQEVEYLSSEVCLHHQILKEQKPCFAIEFVASVDVVVVVVVIIIVVVVAVLVIVAIVVDILVGVVISVAFAEVRLIRYSTLT